MAKPLMCDPSLFKIDLSGRIYVITGANSGIGKQTALQLARQGAQVILACRNVAAGKTAMAEIEAAVAGARLSVEELDLGHLASVRAFAERVLQENPRLDGLVNNAGIMKTPFGKTKDGFELQFGTNHLGHFLLTALLLDALKRAPSARIVNLSSCYHDMAQGRPGRIDFDDPNYAVRKYDDWEAYAQSKLANLLHAKELARRLAGTHVTAVSVHPGWVRTNLFRGTMKWIHDFMAPVLALGGMIEPWEGTQASLYALLSPEVPRHAGAFFSQTGFYRDTKCNRGGWPLVSPNPEARSEENARKLWELSEKLVGLSG